MFVQPSVRLHEFSQEDFSCVRQISDKSFLIRYQIGGALSVSGKNWSDGRGRTTVSDTRPERARYTLLVGNEPHAVEEII
jgi:hypothetical protein